MPAGVTESCAEVERSRKVVSDYIGMAEKGSFIKAPGGAAELAGIIQDAQRAKPGESADKKIAHSKVGYFFHLEARTGIEPV